MPSVKDNSTIVARGGETSVKPPVSLFGALIQLWIVCREIPSTAAISAIGRPLVSVRAIIARRSSSVCRGFLIFESPSVLKTQSYKTHVSGARTPEIGRLRFKVNLREACEDAVLPVSVSEESMKMRMVV